MLFRVLLYQSCHKTVGKQFHVLQVNILKEKKTRLFTVFNAAKLFLFSQCLCTVHCSPQNKIIDGCFREISLKCFKLFQDAEFSI